MRAVEVSKERAWARRTVSKESHERTETAFDLARAPPPTARVHRRDNFIRDSGASALASALKSSALQKLYLKYGGGVAKQGRTDPVRGRGRESEGACDPLKGD